MSNRGVCKTAPATRGLLNIYLCCKTQCKAVLLMSRKDTSITKLLAVHHSSVLPTFLLGPALPFWAGGSFVIYLRGLEELGGHCTRIEMEGLYINLTVWREEPC